MLPKPKIAKSSSSRTDIPKYDWDTHRVEIFALLFLKELKHHEYTSQKVLEEDIQRHTGYEWGLGTNQLENLRDRELIESDPTASHRLRLTPLGRDTAESIPRLIPFKQIILPSTGEPSIDLDRDRLAKMGQPIMREEASEPIRPENVKIASNQRKRVTVGTPQGIRLDPPSAEVGQGGAPADETPADEPEQSEALQAAMATVGLPKMKMTEPYDGKPATDTSRMRRKHGV
jgi:hypothetical protein